VRTFAFRSAFGTFTARKEQASNKRGGWYWRAYRKREGKLHRVYLGKSEEVTLDRMRFLTLTGTGGVGKTSLVLALTLLTRADQSEYLRVRSLFEESLALFRALRQRRYISYPLYQLGKVAARQGNLSKASLYYKESVALFQELDDQKSIAACLEGWTSAVAKQGGAIWATQLWGQRRCCAKRAAQPIPSFYLS
jgi:hypothetical protein